MLKNENEEELAFFEVEHKTEETEDTDTEDTVHKTSGLIATISIGLIFIVVLGLAFINQHIKQHIKFIFYKNLPPSPPHSPNRQT